MKKVIAILLLSFSVGCLPSGDGDATSDLLFNGGACDMVGGNVCMQSYDNIQSADLETLCINQSLYYSPTAEYTIDTVNTDCDPTGAVGICSASIGEFMYYSSSDWPNSAVAESDCLAVHGGFWDSTP